MVTKYRFSLPHPRSGQTIAYIDELNGFLNLLQRQFLRNRRRFWAHLTDGYGNVLFTIHRPFYLISRYALQLVVPSSITV